MFPRISALAALCRGASDTMGRYQLYLHARAEEPPVRQDLTVTDDSEAIAVGSFVADACSDVCKSYEVRRDERILVSAPLGGEDRKVMDLSERQQLIVIDRELALRDSRWHIAESKRLLNRIDAFILAMGYFR
jgi:hypothetical protein